VARLGGLNLGISPAEHAAHGAPKGDHDGDRHNDNKGENQGILDQCLASSGFDEEKKVIF
jgi:hypothetical protein